MKPNLVQEAEKLRQQIGLPSKATEANSLINFIELWLLDEEILDYSRRDSDDGAVLAIKQKDGLLITIQGKTIAINDHLGYACNKKFIKKNDEMRAIEYLDYHDPQLFEKLKGKIK